MKVEGLVLMGMATLTAGQCNNVAFRPRFSFGTRPFGDCQVDDTCSTNCCSGGLCRVSLALLGGATCGNGFSPSFIGPPCNSLAEALAQENSIVVAPTPSPPEAALNANSFTVPSCNNLEFAPGPSNGNAKAGGSCDLDIDCALGCCDLDGKCRDALSLTSGVEFCRNGFTPVSSGDDCEDISEAIGEPSSNSIDADLGNSGPDAFAVAQCANSEFAPDEFGNVRYTGQCTEDAQCETGCCELNKNICLDPVGFETGEEFCTNGFTPVFEGEPCADAASAIGEPVSSNTGVIIGVAIAAVVLVGGFAIRRSQS